MREAYSVVITLPENFNGDVRKMKLLLGLNIGLYSSENSEAHVTMANFMASPTEIDKVATYLNAFCLSCSSQDLEFIKFGSFKTTFHLSSSNDTQQWFENLVKRFNKHFPLNKTACKFKDSRTPHITIGRELDALEISNAYHLFENHIVDIVFPCNSVTIRKYNNRKKQYDVFSHHVFGNKPDLDIENQQLSLFD